MANAITRFIDRYSPKGLEVKIEEKAGRPYGRMYRVSIENYGGTGWGYPNTLLPWLSQAFAVESMKRAFDAEKSAMAGLLKSALENHFGGSGGNNLHDDLEPLCKMLGVDLDQIKSLNR